MSMKVRKITQNWIAEKLPKRPKEAHKGTFGKVLVVAGSENYPGAAYLSCAAAYRVGAGLVTLATTNEVKIIVSRKLPEATFLSFDGIFKYIDKYNVLLLGPGLGQKYKIKNLVKKILNTSLSSAVIDGDGLNILAGINNWWGKGDSKFVLTPHPGEMSRLTGLSTSVIQKNRLNITKKFAKIWNKTIVLKGANTIIVSPAREVVVSPFANPALATAGTGDVLAGMIAGFVAQGLSHFDASCCGVYIHGMTAEVMRQNLGHSGALASDLIPKLPIVIKELTQHTQTSDL